MRSSHPTLDEMISHLLTELITIETRPEQQLIEIRSYPILYRTVENLINQYDFKLDFDSSQRRFYSSADQQQIIDKLKAIRNALVSSRFSEIILAAFDKAQNKFLDQYKIKEQARPDAIEQKEEEKKPVEQKVEEKSEEPAKQQKHVLGKQSWKKSGNFSLSDQKPPDKRKVAYISINPEVLINSITLVERREGLEKNQEIFLIKFTTPKIRNPEVTKILRTHGYYFMATTASSDHVAYIIFVHNIDDLNRTLFLMKQIEGSVAELEPEIWDAMQLLQPSDWIITYEDSCSINYRNYRSPISSVALLETGSLWLHAKLKTSIGLILSELKPILSEREIENFRQTRSIKIDIVNKTHLEKILTAIQEAEPSIAYIMAKLIKKYKDQDPLYNEKLALLSGLRPPQPGKPPSPLYLAFQNNRPIADLRIFNNIFSFAFPTQRRTPVEPAAAASASREVRGSSR